MVLDSQLCQVLGRTAVKSMMTNGPYYANTSTGGWLSTVLITTTAFGTGTDNTFGDTTGTYADTSDTYYSSTNYAICGPMYDMKHLEKKWADLLAQPYRKFGQAGRFKVFQDHRKEKVMDDQTLRRMIVRQRRSC